MKHYFLVSIVLMVFLSQQVFAQLDDHVRYILSPVFEPTKSLDVINDGQNNKVGLDKTQNVTGQFWKITPVQGMEGYFRLSPDFQPTKSLDVINDGQNNMVVLNKTQNVSGQVWKITAVDGMPDCIRLSPNFQPTKSLDVINDGQNNKVWLDNTQNVSGQVWKLSMNYTHTTNPNIVNTNKGTRNTNKGTGNTNKGTGNTNKGTGNTNTATGNTSQAVSFNGCATGSEDVTADNASFEQKVFELTNAERAKKGLPAFQWSDDLARAARYHATDMFVDGYFEHDSFDKVNGQLVNACGTFDRIKKFVKGSMRLWAENIAAGQSSPEEAIRTWVNSPGHYANMLSNNASLGVGYYKGNWVQVFGKW